MQNFQKAEEIYLPYNNENNLKNFIINNFSIPDNNIEEIISFIDKNISLKNLIYQLPMIIKSEFPNDKLKLNIYEDEWEIQYLNIVIVTSYNGEISVIKENKIYELLLEKFDFKSWEKILFEMEY